jgi:polar amino acid transport system substrate-binding protein
MRIVPATFVLLIALCSPLWAADLEIFTEEYPPYNTMQNGKLEGINTEKVLKILDAAGLQTGRSDIKLVPWSRAYQKTLKAPNTCVYSTTRTAERDKLFAWVGPLSKSVIALIARKGTSGQLGSIAEAKGKSIGVIKDDIGEQLVVAQGIPKSKLDITPSFEGNLKKLKAGRIDYFAYEVNAFNGIAKGMGVNPADFEPVYTLKEGELYLACNPKTDKGLLDALEKGYQTVK